ncbi:MAG: DUF2171 domain-containing protein [Novosphingobium sp.]
MPDRDYAPKDSRDVTSQQNTPGEPTGWRDKEAMVAHERANDGPLRADEQPPAGVRQAHPFTAEEAARGFADRIREGMEVISNEGSHIGTVAGIEGDEIVLTREASSREGREFVPLSLIDAIDGNRVITRGRGDNSFGEEAIH